MSVSKESSCNVDVYRLFYTAYTLKLSYFHCAKKGQIQPTSRSFKKRSSPHDGAKTGVGKLFRFLIFHTKSSEEPKEKVITSAGRSFLSPKLSL